MSAAPAAAEVEDTEVKQSQGAQARAWSAPVLAAGLLAAQGTAIAQDPPVRPNQELRRQQERERQLREQQQRRPDIRLERPAAQAPDRLPESETPCFAIGHIRLVGEDSGRFTWALNAASLADDRAEGRCLGSAGIDLVMRRVQNAIVGRGYVTTRVLAAPQDLNGGELVLTLVPGRIRAVRFAPGTDSRATVWNALPAGPGDLLNLRDIEQALENLKRVPTVEADIQIAPAEGPDAKPGDSDLIVRRAQSRRFRFSTTLDDSGSESTGKTQAGATLSLDHGWMWNDLFYLNLSHDAFNGGRKGTSSWTAHYEVPLDYWLIGATASAYDYGQPVQGDSQSYLYSGGSRNAELRASRLLFRNATTKFGAYARGWYRESDNSIDDTEILVQRRRTAGWELGLTYRRFVGAATLDLGAAHRRGTGAWGALAAPEEAFGEGTSRMKLYTADAQLMVPFKLGEQALRYSAGWRAQWNRTPLTPQDRFAIGGRYTVRGFDGESSLTGQHGWWVRNDLGLPLGGRHELYVGADYGHVGGGVARKQSGNRLAGAVLGLRGGAGRANWDVFVGAPVEQPRGFASAYTATGFNLSWSL